MDRLQEFSIVTMSLPDLGRVSEFKAFVLGVHRHVATLQPVEHVESMWLPPLVENVHLLFRHNGRNVGLKGDLRCGERPENIEFRVTDGVCVPRRRSSRLAICAPVTVTLEDGGELDCQTQDIGADGLTLERAPGLDAEQLVSVSVMLPWESEEVCAQARVTGGRRRRSGGAGARRRGTRRPPPPDGLRDRAAPAPPGHRPLPPGGTQR